MLYHEVTNNGYYIKDTDNPNFLIHQYEPYIPYRGDNYSESAQNHINMIENPPEYENTYGLPKEVYNELKTNIETSTIDTIKKEVTKNEE